MRHSLLRLMTGAAIVLVVAFSSLTAADAQSVMKVCGDQWKAAKAAGTTNGETWPQFLAQCRAQQSGGGAAPLLRRRRRRHPHRRRLTARRLPEARG